MEIPQQALDELKGIHKKVTGEDLTDKEALDMGMNLLTLFPLIYKPIPKALLEQQKEEFPDLYDSLTKSPE